MAAVILLVDDSATHRSLVKVFLSGYDLTFLEAENGLRALEIVERTQVHLAIVDLNMPEMDGITFVRRCRASARWEMSSLPIVLLTSEKDATQVAEAVRAGADECLRKPVSSAGVLEAVQRILGTVSPVSTGKR